MDNMLGKCGNFAKPDPKPDPDAHFAIVHYAAKVSYNLSGWLEKNKDPLNDTIVEMMKNGTNALVVQCFADHPGQPTETPKDQGGSKKKGGGKTVSSFYKGQLDDLMKTLYATDPAFIRCVVPNTHKQPGGIEPGLVMHQYQCNGVLAGIAICRAGFPNKVVYPEFKSRYNILAAAAVAKAKKDKDAAMAVFKVIKLDEEKFRLGHTKVFFRAGILGFMEEVREDRIGAVLSWLQAQARGKASRITFKKMQDQKLALYCLQRTIRNFRIGKTWLWWQLWLAIKPNLKCTKFAQYKAEYEEKMAMAADVQKSLDEVNNRIAGEKAQMDAIGQAQSKIGATKAALGEEIGALEAKLAAAEQDRADKDAQIRSMKEEIEHQNDAVSKLNREKKGGAEAKQKTEEDIQSMEDRCNHLARLKGKLEQNLDEAEDSLQPEVGTENIAACQSEDILSCTVVQVNFSALDEQ